MFRDGDSLNTQPEKMRRHLSSRPWTSACRKAPVSFSGSHGAVVSHARRRTIRSPSRIAWPGFIVRSRAMPLRLLSTPITATRWAMGVAVRTAGAARGVAGCEAAGGAPAPSPAALAADGGDAGGAVVSFCSASAACHAPRPSSPASAVAAIARFTGSTLPAPCPNQVPARDRSRHGPCRSRTGRSWPSGRSRPACR